MYVEGGGGIEGDLGELLGAGVPLVGSKGDRNNNYEITNKLFFS